MLSWTMTTIVWNFFLTNIYLKASQQTKLSSYMVRELLVYAYVAAQTGVIYFAQVLMWSYTKKTQLTTLTLNVVAVCLEKWTIES